MAMPAPPKRYIPGRQPRKIFKVSDFEKIQEIGWGNYSKVFLAKEKKSQMKVALKELNIEQMIAEVGEWQLTFELLLQSQCGRHPHIIRYLTHFRSGPNMYVIHQYVPNGNLFDYIQNQRGGRLEEKQAKKYGLQIASALGFIHDLMHAHNDVKPENIVLDENFDAKLTDFGLCFRASPLRENAKLLGTLEYQAPEILNNEYQDMRVDIWSLGILIFEMLVGKSPFNHNDQTETATRINFLKYKFTKRVSTKARNLISRMLLKIDDRITLYDAVNHEWFTEQKDKEYLKPVYEVVETYVKEPL